MLITKELIMTLLMVLGIGKYSEIKSPKYYELVTEDGKTHQIKLGDKHYACPLHCKAEHFHSTVKLDRDNTMIDVYNIDGYKSDTMYLNSYAVVSSEQIKLKTNKNNKLKKLDVQTYLP